MRLMDAIDLSKISGWILDRYQDVDNGYVILTRGLQTVAIIVAFVILRSGLQRLVTRQFKTPNVVYAWRKGIRYTCDGLIIILVINIWFESGQSFATYIGLLSAGIAIALQDPIASLFAWIYIAYQDPFNIGDRIEINGLKGDVVDIHPLQFTLLEIGGKWVDADQNTGRFIHVPNRLLFKQTLINETKNWPFIWQEIPVVITFESDWERAKRLLHEIMNDHVLDVVDAAEKYRLAKRTGMNVRHGRLTPIVYTTVEPHGIELTLRFLSEIRQRRARTQSIWETVLRQLPHEKQIELAYPTRRIVSDAPQQFEMERNIRQPE